MHSTSRRRRFFAGILVAAPLTLAGWTNTSAASLNVKQLLTAAAHDMAGDSLVDWRLLPNLAMDLVVPALAQLMPLEAAGRVFIALIMLGCVVATAVLQLVDLGRLKKSDPIATWYPWFPNASNITIDDLLLHAKRYPRGER